MGEVVEHLYNRPYKGQIYIDDATKAAIEAYYRTYGAEELALK
jgi:orotate phosphoribosyltransferase